MKRIAVVGTGLVGTGWVVVFARAGHDVSMYDAVPLAAESALARIDDILLDLAERDLIVESPSIIKARVTLASSLDEACDGAVYVQESGPERVEAKRDLFVALEQAADRETVLASSSSGITASRFAEDMETRDRCIVAHPVNPPYLVPVVEISPAPFTSRETVAVTKQLMDDVKQVPVMLEREIDGFVLNRLQGALLHEAFRLVEDGVALPEDIDKTVRDGLGLRWSFMGPFETIDLNAPGGVRDYVERLGPLYLELMQQRSAPRPWTGTLLDRVEADRRRHLNVDDIGERAAWRDRRLMDLLSHKASYAAKSGSGENS